MPPVVMKYCETPELTEFANKLSGVIADTYINVGFELYTTKPSSSDRRLIKALDQQLNDATFVVESPVIGSYSEFPLSPPKDRIRSKPSHSNLNGNPATNGASNSITSNGAVHSGAGSLHTGTGPVGGISKRRALSTPASTSPMVVGSPFGPLAEVGNMKQYVYLIAVLNASDPDRDFSALQPSSFRRIYQDVFNPLEQSITALGVNPPPTLWTTLDAEISISDCKAYSLELPQQFLEDDDSGVSWSKMFFFFNKRRKRVLFVNLNSRPASYHRESSSDNEGVVGELE